MTLPNAATLYDVIAATWPAAQTRDVGPWTIRQGRGGGSRVSAATARDWYTQNDLFQAEAAMHDLGQRPLFMIRETDDALDQILQEAGYVVKDPSVLYAAPITDIATTRPQPATVFPVWPALTVQREIWASGGIGPDRLAVMDRAATPKTTILGRLDETPGGTAFVGNAHGCTMIHALEIAPDCRRRGLAASMTRGAAFWGQSQGAEFLTLITTQANTAANHLYTSLGMTVVGNYHYRTLPED